MRCRQPLSLASLVSREGARLVDIDECDDVDVAAASGSSDADARKAASARVARSARAMTASSAAAAPGSAKNDGSVTTSASRGKTAKTSFDRRDARRGGARRCDADGARVLRLGGDHSIALGSLSAVLISGPRLKLDLFDSCAPDDSKC